MSSSMWAHPNLKQILGIGTAAFFLDKLQWKINCIKLERGSRKIGKLASCLKMKSRS